MPKVLASPLTQEQNFKDISSTESKKSRDSLIASMKEEVQMALQQCQELMDKELEKTMLGKKR